MDATEYNHVTLGMTSLKYICDIFEEHCDKLVTGQIDYFAANPEYPDEYVAENLIDVTPTVELTADRDGEKAHRSVHLLGRVHEYFLTRFASAERIADGFEWTRPFGGCGKSTIRASTRWSAILPAHLSVQVRAVTPTVFRISQ